MNQRRLKRLEEILKSDCRHVQDFRFLLEDASAEEVAAAEEVKICERCGKRLEPHVFRFVVIHTPEDATRHAAQ